MFKKFIKITAITSISMFSIILLLAAGVHISGIYKFSFDKNVQQEENSQAERTEGKTEELQTPDEKKTLMEEMTIYPENYSKSKDFKLAFAGDIFFPDYLLERYAKDGITGIISEELLKEMKMPDLMIANEEFPMGVTGEAMEDKEYTFRLEPSAVGILKELHIDLVTLANNHTLDYGRSTLEETFSILDNADISYIGAGKDLERAKQPYIQKLGNKKIGILGASRVIPVASWSAGKNSSGVLAAYDPKILLQAIEETKMSCDIVAVYVHWGIERNEMPEAYQRELAKQFIDAGADLVVGSHPHVLQGIEFYKGKPILYSLGNYIFGASTKKSVLLKAEINEEDEWELYLVPCKMENYQMQKMTDTEGEELFEYLTGISFGAQVDSEGKILSD